MGFNLIPALTRLAMYGAAKTAPRGYRTIHRLNRSQNWRPARSYTHARSISPYPDRPVR